MGGSIFVQTFFPSVRNFGSPAICLQSTEIEGFFLPIVLFIPNILILLVFVGGVLVIKPSQNGA